MSLVRAQKLCVWVCACVRACGVCERDAAQHVPWLLDASLVPSVVCVRVRACGWRREEGDGDRRALLVGWAILCILLEDNMFCRWSVLVMRCVSPIKLEIAHHHH